MDDTILGVDGEKRCCRDKWWVSHSYCRKQKALHEMKSRGKVTLRIVHRGKEDKGQEWENRALSLSGLTARRR